MNLSAILLSALALGAGAVVTTSWQGPPQPGPEHEILKSLVGTWDAEVNFMGTVEKGATFKTQLLGGRWLVGEFSGTMMGEPLEGREALGWDADKKKYVSCWVDNMAQELAVTSGSASTGSKGITLEGETHDPMSGAKVPMRNVYTVVGPDHVRFEMHVGDLNAPALMTIDYKRKK